jgi:hypothetical protein
MNADMNNCKHIEKHTPCPKGYIEWHEWAEKMGKTHNQIKCHSCGFLVVWVEKNPLNNDIERER